MTVLLAGCARDAWNNSPPPLHSRIRMQRSGTNSPVAATTPVTDFNHGADFDTNKLQGAGGASGLSLQPSTPSSRGALSSQPSTISSPIGSATRVPGGTSTGSGSSTPSSTLNSQPSPPQLASEPAPAARLAVPALNQQRSTLRLARGQPIPPQVQAPTASRKPGSLGLSRRQSARFVIGL
jgi:hypothetical protein